MLESPTSKRGRILSLCPGGQLPFCTLYYQITVIRYSNCTSKWSSVQFSDKVFGRFAYCLSFSFQLSGRTCHINLIHEGAIFLVILVYFVLKGIQIHSGPYLSAYYSKGLYHMLYLFLVEFTSYMIKIFLYSSYNMSI